MCTCIAYENGDFYFGRNMDLDYSIGEQIILTPRNYLLELRKLDPVARHYAMVGMAASEDKFPLYAEAVNEKGLFMAGLNFPENAVYQEAEEGWKNITPFELIPWILASCSSVQEAREHLFQARIVGIPFAREMPLAPLHWMLADGKECLVLEAVEEGLKIYENPIKVLTNNPPFPFHREYLTHFRKLSPGQGENTFSRKLHLEPYCQGMGGMGLPGDASSASRFVRAAFLLWNSRCEKEENANVSQVFHILDQVSMVKGTVLTEEGTCDMTTYSCCVNGKRGVYYYKTYENTGIQAVELAKEELEGEGLVCYKVSLKGVPVKSFEREFNW